MITTTQQQAQPIQKRGARGLIVMLLSVPAWAPLLHPGFVQTHSGLGAVYDALAARPPLSGWLPSYATPGDGPLGSWLLAALPAALSPLAALKLLYATSFMVAGIGMYMLARRAWGAWPALVAAAVYMLIPYRLVAVFVRGALAEALVLALAPFLLLTIHEATRSPRRRNLLLVVLLTVAVVLTNFGLGVLAAAAGIVWALTVVAPAEPRDAKPYARACVLCACSMIGAFLLGLLVLLPSGDRFLANTSAWHEHFVHFFQLFSPAWGFGESTAGWQDSMPFQLGLAPVALAMVALWGALESKDAALRRAVLVLTTMTCVLVTLALTVAAPVWRIAPLSALVAYPWQLLGLAALPLALLAAAAAHAMIPPDRPASMATLAVLLSAIVLGSYAYLSPRYLDAADVPDLTHAPLVQLGEEILLLDARWDGAGQAGGAIKLTLTWQALRQPTGDYTIFAHLVDAQGVQRGQTDVRPHNDQKPTTTWLRGEVVRDEITVPVKPDAPPGQYRLNVGMYALATMQRLPVAGSDQGMVDVGAIAVR